MSGPRCPLCPVTLAADVSPIAALVRPADHTEDFRSTHECNRCRVRFRYTPPSAQAAPASLVTAPGGSA